MSEETAHVQDLADEVLLLIFEHLPDQALLHARCVCAQWKAVAEDPTLLYVALNSIYACVLHYKLNTQEKRRFL